MVIFLAAAALQSGIAVNSKPAEPIIAVEQPRPDTLDETRVAIAPRIPRPSPASPAVVVPLRVRVTAGNRVLLNDVMRVARNSGASYSENRSEAGEVVCMRPGHYGPGERHALSVNLGWREDASVGEAVNVSVNWQRPGAGADPCAGEGSRTIGLSETVPLERGQTRTISGDGGLAVTISRP